MKTTTCFITLIYVCISVFVWGQAGINTTGNPPHNSAALDIDFTNHGLLIPSVALTQTTSSSPIGSPATSLLVYNTATQNDVTPGYYYWDGSKWVRFATGNGGVNCNTANYVLKSDGYNALCSQIFDNGTNVGIGTNNPGFKLEVAGNMRATQDIYFGTVGSVLSPNQGGSIELGPSNSNAGETPFIDFHYGAGVAQDYNVRIINDANGRLNLIGTVRINNAYNLPGSDGTNGQVLMTNGAGTVSWQTMGAGVATFINPIDILSGYTGNHGDINNLNWQTVNLSPYVPAGTKQVIVQVHWGISGPDGGDIDAFLLARKNASSSYYIIARGRSAANKDNVAELLQGVIPIDENTRTFQYAVEYPGFNGGIYFSVIAYY